MLSHDDMVVPRVFDWTRRPSDTGVAEKMSAFSLRLGRGVHQLLTLRNHYFTDRYKGKRSFLNGLSNGKCTMVSNLECEEFV
jgi:hypothetical protein